MKAFIRRLFVLTLASLFVLNSYSQSEEPSNYCKVGDLWYYIDNGEATVISQRNYEAHGTIIDRYYTFTSVVNCYKNEVYTIPSSISRYGVEYPVTSIGTNAFTGCDNVTTIVIPESVKNILGNSITYNHNLEMIVIPKGVQTIGAEAFAGNDKLSSIKIPNSITSLGKDIFKRCENLSNIELEEGLKSIGQYAFHNCTSLDAITIPNSVTSIGQYAFAGCTSLTSIEVPNTVTSVGNNAFGGCTSLKTVFVGNSVTTIEAETFYNCSSLETVSIGNAVTSIGNSAFKKCHLLDAFICNTKRAPTLGTTVFGEVDLAFSTLYVPETSVKGYSGTEIWNEFGAILPLSQAPEIPGSDPENPTTNGDYATLKATVEAQQTAIENLTKRIEALENHTCGDVNGDNKVTISDVNLVIDRALKQQ